MSYIVNYSQLPATPDAALQTSAVNIHTNLLADVVKPDYMKHLFDRYGEGIKGMFTLYNLRDRGVIPTGDTTVRHFEEARTKQPIRVQSNATAGGAGQNLNITVATNQLRNNASTPRVQDLLAIPNVGLALVTAKDTGSPVGTQTADGFTPIAPGALGGTPTAHVLRLAPWDNNVTLSVTTSMVIPVMTNQVPEGSTPKDGLLPDLFEYANTTSIIRGNFKSTRTALGEVTWFETEDDMGRKGTAYAYLAILKLKKDYLMNGEGQLMINQSTTNPTLIAAGYNGSQGLESFIRESGYVRNVPTGAMTFTDIDRICQYYAQEGGNVNELDVWSGFLKNRDFSTLLRQANYGTQVNYTSQGSDGNLRANFGFEGFKLNNMQFNLINYKLFDNPTFFGATGQPYPSMSLLIPQGEAEVDMGNKKSKMPYMCIRTMTSPDSAIGIANGNEIRPGEYYSEWGNMSANGKNGYDGLEASLVSESCLHPNQGNKFGLIEG